MGAYELNLTGCPTFPHTVAASDVSDLVFSITCANVENSDDVINLTADSTYTLTAVDNNNGGNNGLPAILNAAAAGTLTINGNGATITRDGTAPAFRLFYLIGGADLTLDSLNLSNGSSSGDGGAIYMTGSGGGAQGSTLTVSSSTLSGNSASTTGGAISGGGTLVVSNSTFSGNSANHGGGGIRRGGGTLVVSSSTFSGNSAFEGGAINQNGGTTTISSSTFSTNTGSDGSGGIRNDHGVMTITNSTITGNSSDKGAIENTDAGTLTVTNSTIADNSGGGIYNNTNTLTLNNSIVANNSGGNCKRDGGTINAQNSLIESGLGCVNGTNSNNLTDDPSLGTLTGSPAYFPLNSDSIAINQGDNALALDADGNPLATDEAGNTRIQQGTVDMGAYESAYTAPVKQIAFVQQPTDADVNATISPAVTVQLLDVNGNLVTTATDSVTLSISTNPGGGTLGGTVSVNAVNGVATFNDLSIDAAGTGYTLDASVIGLTNVTSDPFTITAVSIPILIDRTSSFLVITDDVNLVAEGASIGDRFAFELTQQPTDDVTVTFTSSDPTQLEIIDPTVRGRYAPVGSYTVTFSASGGHGAHTVPWNSPVVINLYGVPDAVAEGAQTYAIQFSLSSGDPAYNNLAVPDEPVTVYDTGVTNSPTSLTLPEGGSGSYTIVLDGPPGFLALTTALGGNQDEHVTVTVDGTDYTFTRSNWDTPQTVTVTAPTDGGVCTGNRDVSVSETVTSDISLNPYMDSGYGGPTSPASNVTAPDEIIHVTDPDCAATRPNQSGDTAHAQRVGT